MRAMMKTVTAAALLMSGASGAFAQSVEFAKIHEGAQVAGVCGSLLSQAQENKVAQIAAVSAGNLQVGEVLSSETKIRGGARVQAYSFGCQDAKNVQAIQYYSEKVK